MAVGKNKTDWLTDDRVTPTELRAFMKNLTELLTLNNTRPAAQLDGTKRRISGVDDWLEILETRLPPTGQAERAEEDLRRLHYRGKNNRDPFIFSGSHDAFSINDYVD